MLLAKFAKIRCTRKISVIYSTSYAKQWPRQAFRIQSKTSSCSVLWCAHSPRTSARWGFLDRETVPFLPLASGPGNACKSTSTSTLQHDGRLERLDVQLLGPPTARSAKQQDAGHREKWRTRFRTSAAWSPRLIVARSSGGGRPAADHHPDWLAALKPNPLTQC